MNNKEMLLDLLQQRQELLPVIHSILADDGISEVSYANVFSLVFFSEAQDVESEIAYCKGAEEWRQGKITLTDAKLFSLLAQVCDIVRYYVLASWDDCILSAWGKGKEILKAEKEMTEMESLAHLHNILKIASESMVYNSDGVMAWVGDDGFDDDDDDNCDG
jgi:hypothetical protein